MAEKETYRHGGDYAGLSSDQARLRFYQVAKHYAYNNCHRLQPIFRASKGWQYVQSHISLTNSDHIATPLDTQTMDR
jgi:hypothetical protein